jgi:alpha-ribazole phosphatase
MEIYLIRHTTLKIEKGICYGQSDIPLAETFDAEKKILFTQIPEQVDAVYSSPLDRCYQLAELIKTQRINSDRRLLEMNFGDWELKKWDAISEEELNLWMKDFVTVRVPGGENFLDLQKRVADFTMELITKKLETVVIVTHAGVIRCFVAAVLEMSLTNAFKLNIDYSSSTKIHLYEDSCLNKLEYLNNVYKQ